jgi:Protein of unknown function (DUF4089)
VTLTPAQAEAWIDAAAAALALPIAPEHRPGVLHYLVLASRFAAEIEALPLSPHDDSAVSFVPDR